jgi:hypothetical protein
MKYSFILASFVLLVPFAVPAAAFAASGTVQTGVTNTPLQIQTGVTNTDGTGQIVTLLDPLGSGTSLESFLASILAFIVRIGTVIVILMLVFVGYKFVVAQGEPGKITEARSMLLWTVIGALVLLGAQAIASAIEATVKALGG